MRFRLAQIKNRKHLSSYLHYYNKPDSYYYICLKNDISFGKGKIKDDLRKKFYKAWFLDDLSLDDLADGLKNFFQNFFQSNIVSYILCFDPFVRCSDRNYKKDFVYAVIDSFNEIWEDKRQFAVFFHDDTACFHFHSLIHPLSLNYLSLERSNLEELKIEELKIEEGIKKEIFSLKENIRRKMNVIFNTYSKEIEREFLENERREKERRERIRGKIEGIGGLNTNLLSFRQISEEKLRAFRKSSKSSKSSKSRNVFEEQASFLFKKQK